VRKRMALFLFQLVNEVKDNSMHWPRLVDDYAFRAYPKTLDRDHTYESM
jgi:hypothetical protein